MQRFSISIAAVVSGLAMVQAVYAADLPVKAPRPAAVVPYSWSGCYVGVNGGWIGNHSTLHLQPSGAYLNNPNFPPALLDYVTQDYSANGSSGTVGGEIGCNFQRENWVWGLEADLDWTGLSDSIDANYPLTPIFSGRAFNPRTLTITQRQEWLSTIRGRLGYSFDRWLVFATGGLAIGEVKSSFYQNFFTVGITDQGSASETRVGWTVGGGVEYAFYRNWSAKLEYLYVDLGSFSYNSPASDDPSFLWTTTVKTRENIVRAGLNYKFN